MSKTNEEQVAFHLNEAIRITRGIMLYDHEHYNCLDLRAETAKGLARQQGTVIALNTELKEMERYLLEMNAFIQSLERSKSQLTYLSNTSAQLNKDSVAKKAPFEEQEDGVEVTLEVTTAEPSVLDEKIAGLNRRLYLVTCISVAAILTAIVAIMH